MRASVRALEKAVGEARNGSLIYINAINLSAKGIDRLREMIERQELKVYEPDLCIVKEEYKDAYRSGRSIAPQMRYIKTGEVVLKLH